MKVKATDAYQTARDQMGNDFAQNTGVQYWMFWNIHGYADFAGGGNDALSDPYTVYARQQVQKLSKYSFSQSTFNDARPLAFAEPNTKAIADSLTQIQDKGMPQIITAASQTQASQQYDAMLAEMDKAGMKTLDAAYTKVYQDKMVPILGNLA